MKSLSRLVFRFDSIISGSGSQLVASDICSNIHTKIVSLFCVRRIGADAEVDIPGKT